MIHTLEPMAVATSPADDLLPEHIIPTSARNYLSCSLRFWFEKLSGTLQFPARDGTRVVAMSERISALERSQ